MKESLTLKQRLQRKIAHLFGLEIGYNLQTNSALTEVGWVNSIKQNAIVDKEGLPIPWLNYPSIAFLSERVTPEFRIFEWGMGSSTAWWASRSKEVVSIEHDEEWFKKASNGLPTNCTCHLYSLDNPLYCDAISQLGSFDLILIDGRNRVKCSEIAPKHLNDSGVLIWDNTENPKYRDGINALKQSGFLHLPLVGMCPNWPFQTETSIFYRRNNCFGL